MRVIVCLAALTATLGAAPLARAQPVTRPDPCSITIPRAPAEVRAEIERAVQAGPRCTSSLEVRAVPSDGGFYVSARDDHGTVRDGIAPDAARAGELVASWVADDAAAQGAVGPTAPGTPTEPPEYGEPADPGEQLAPVTAHDERTQLAPPEIAPPAGTLIVRAGPAEPRGVNHLMLGGLSGSGARAPSSTCSRCSASAWASPERCTPPASWSTSGSGSTAARRSTSRTP